MTMSTLLLTEPNQIETHSLLFRIVPLVLFGLFARFGSAIFKEADNLIN